MDIESENAGNSNSNSKRKQKRVDSVSTFNGNGILHANTNISTTIQSDLTVLIPTFRWLFRTLAVFPVILFYNNAANNLQHDTNDDDDDDDNDNGKAVTKSSRKSSLTGVRKWTNYLLFVLVVFICPMLFFYWCTRIFIDNGTVLSSFMFSFAFLLSVVSRFGVLAIYAQFKHCLNVPMTQFRNTLFLDTNSNNIKVLKQTNVRLRVWCVSILVVFAAQTGWKIYRVTVGEREVVELIMYLLGIVFLDIPYLVSQFVLSLVLLLTQIRLNLLNHRIWRYRQMLLRVHRNDNHDNHDNNNNNNIIREENSHSHSHSSSADSNLVDANESDDDDIPEVTIHNDNIAGNVIQEEMVNVNSLDENEMNFFFDKCLSEYMRIEKYFKDEYMIGGWFFVINVRVFSNVIWLWIFIADSTNKRDVTLSGVLWCLISIYPLLEFLISSNGLTVEYHRLSRCLWQLGTDPVFRGRRSNHSGGRSDSGIRSKYEYKFLLSYIGKHPLNVTLMHGFEVSFVNALKFLFVFFFTELIVITIV